MNIHAFYRKCNAAHEQKQPFVCFKSPSTNGIKAYLQQDKKVYEDTDGRPGFVFAPFDTSEKTVIMPEDKAETITSEFIKSPKQLTTIVLHHDAQDTKALYLKLVNDAIAAIENTGLKKVVVSRAIEMELPNFDILAIFNTLCNQYPTAFVYCWYHPEIGLWLGATPERLLTVQNGRFETMALASTQVDTGAKKMKWTAKEIEEQRLVTDYLLEQLTDIKKINVSKPYNKKAGNLWHICTEISGKLSKDYPVGQLIKRLHPTPAVCGYPKEQALEFIKNSEKYNREFYTGYLGERNVKGKTAVFVNLRCMQIKGNNAYIYVGGGITVDSDPQAEWEETQRKSETILEVL